MKTKGLQIGNLIQDKHGNIEAVHELLTVGDHIDRVNDEPYEGYYSPIPLTHHWALKLGFEFDTLFETDPPVYYKIGTSYYLHSETLQPLNSGFPIAEHELKYVHQLQNFHQALTGEELTIKEKV